MFFSERDEKIQIFSALSEKLFLGSNPAKTFQAKTKKKSSCFYLGSVSCVFKLSGPYQGIQVILEQFHIHGKISYGKLWRLQFASLLFGNLKEVQYFKTYFAL